jgi:hypothetical protein
VDTATTMTTTTTMVAMTTMTAMTTMNIDRIEGIFLFISQMRPSSAPPYLSPP